MKYAPELKIVGVAAAAPASELALLFEDDLTTKAGEGLTSLTLWSWSRLYDVPLQAVVKPPALVDVAAVGAECLAGFSDLITDVRAIDQIQTVGFLAADPVKTKPWTEIIAWEYAGSRRARCPGLHRARYRRYHRRSAGHDRLRGYPLPQGSGSSTPAGSGRNASANGEAQCACGDRVDGGAFC